MTVRAVEWKQPYTWGTAIEIDENKVISLRLRDENNLIIYDAGDNEIYVDLQLPDELTPTDAFPVWITTGRVIVDNGWDLQWTLICAKTTSGDNIKLLYADEWTLWIDNWTWTFKQILFKSDIDTIVTTLTTYIDWELAKKQNWVTSATAPTDPEEWDLWYDTAHNTLKVYNWSSWVSTWWGWGGSWDVVVSTDTGNELSTGAGLWFWTETDYSSISTPDTNTLYIQYKSHWWQPGANTLLYLPLDSTNTLNDLSGNGYNMTNNGNVSFWTYGWVDCAYFWTTAPYWLKNTSANIISWDYTFLVWLNWDSYDSGTDFPRIFWWNNNWWLLWERRFELIHPVFLWTSAWVAYTSWWHLLAFTGNISTKIFTPYKDGVQLTGWTWNSGTSYTWILIGANESNNSEPVDRFCGYMSAVIWENRQRTATEITDYYNQTKSLYWIS